MPEGQLLTIFIMVILLCFSAFFSGSEAAFLSVERVRIAHLLSSGAPGARLVAEMLEKPERLLSTILLGNNLVNIAFSSLATVMAVRLLGDSQGVLVATVLGTIVVLIFGEITPKSIAVRNAERVAFLNARPLRAVEFALWPVIVVLQWLTHRVQILFSGSSRGQVISITEGEIRMLLDISEAEGTLESSEVEMLENVFRFGDRQVREVMTPRPEIIALKRGANLQEFLDIYAQHSHTRFPVYKDSVDDIIGLISAKDVLKAMATRGISYEDSVTDVIRDALFVPETKRIAELFDEMRLSGNQMAMVVDEYGGLAGVATLKRLSEEVVGPVGEEGEAPEEEYEAIDENTFQIEGGMSIEEANEELKLNLPEGEFDTVAGFVLQTLGHIPVEGEQFDYRSLSFEVVEMSDLKIEAIKVTRLQPVGSASDSGEEPPIAPE